MKKIQYQECESKRIDALKSDENEVWKEIRKSKGKGKRKLVNEAIKSAELISIYGKVAFAYVSG